MELWHGSEVVVEHPSLDKCRRFLFLVCKTVCQRHDLAQAIAAHYVFGDLGIQYALMSERAFSAIKFRDWKQASGAEFYPKRFEREQNARRKYLDTVNGFDSDGVDIRDLMAGRVDLNDPRVNGLWAE